MTSYALLWRYCRSGLAGATALGLMAGGALSQTMSNSFTGLSRNSNQPINIESDVLIVHDAQKYATFKGDVKAIQGTTTLRSKTLDVFYTGGSSVTGASASSATDQKAGNSKSAAATTAASGAPLPDDPSQHGIQAIDTEGWSPVTSADSASPKPAPEKAASEVAAPKKVSGKTKGGKTAAAAPSPSASGKNSDAKGGAAGSKAAGGMALGNNGSQITKLIAKGDVIITSDQDQTTTSDWAVYDVAGQKVTVGGNVVLTQGKNVLKGDRLVMDLTTNESRFENPGNMATGGRIQALFIPKQTNAAAPAKTPGKTGSSATDGSAATTGSSGDTSAASGSTSDAPMQILPNGGQ